MKTVALDVHTEMTQLCVCLADGRVVAEKAIETKAEVLRREVGAVQGPKRVVFENGPLAGMVMDAVRGVAEEVISCDATRNALIARADDSNDRNDALAAYAGLGLKQDVSNWRAGPSHASRRGQRQVKRVLFLAARAVVRWADSAFARRYAARRAMGWEDRKAIRDVARQLLFAVCHVWRTGEEYDDARINVPLVSGAR
jgi:hypothetical protein